MLLFVLMLTGLKKYAPFILSGLKIVVIFGSFYLIYTKIGRDADLISASLIYKYSPLQLFVVLFLMLLLSSLNWLLEFYKWKILVSSIQNISVATSMQQCLTAHTTTLLTPYKIGDYGVKALFYDAKNVPKILYLNFLGNAAQLLMTLFFGFIGWFFYRQSFTGILPSFFKSNLLVVLFFLMLLFVMMQFLSKHLKYSFLNSIPTSIHFKNGALSLVRFLLFSHQYLFLLMVVNPNLVYFNSLMTIFTMYVLVAIMPTFALFDWAIKGSIGILLFSALGFNPSEIMLISLLMWFFNFALPAVGGSYFMLKFNKTKSTT